MNKFFRLAVIILCIAWLALLFGCNKEKYILDGPDMARAVWREFTISGCTVTYEPIYNYTAKYDESSNEGWLYINRHEGESVEKNIRLESDAVNALFRINVLTFPDAEPLTGTVRGLTVKDSNGRTYQKSLSSANEQAILEIFAPYLDALNAEDESEEPFMLDGPSMEYSPKWVSFSVSRRDSSTHYSFWFTVDEDKMTVVGECQDREGHTYSVTEGIAIPQEVIDALHALELEQLPDEEPWPEDLEIPLDDNCSTLTLTFSDEETVKKNANGVTIEIYNLLLPYFKNH